MNYCELCEKNVHTNKKTLVLIGNDELKDMIICRECIEEISVAQYVAEIKTVKEIKERNKK